MDLHSLLCLLFLILYPSYSLSYPEPQPHHFPQLTPDSNNTVASTLIPIQKQQQQLTPPAKIPPSLALARPLNKNNIRLGRSIPSSRPTLTNPRIHRIINFLERKNIYKKYNLDRALEEWARLKKESRSVAEIEDNAQEVIRLLCHKVSLDYDKQKDEMWRNPNATGNSLIFRSLLKFFVEGLDKEQHYKHFPFLSSQLTANGIREKMSLDDAIILTYIWNQIIIEGGLLEKQFNESRSDSLQEGSSTRSSSLSVVTVSEENERLVRNVVRAGNRIYPAAPPPNEPLTINDWWLRQRQHSQNVYKIYNVVDALVKGCRKYGVETATIYEALVDEYRASGRPLDAYELNMIDYVAYRMFGMIEHADPNRW